jgi:hypothetical protein
VVVVTGVIVCSTFVGCGGDSPPMRGDAATDLHAQVIAVRAAVEAHDADGAAGALDDLRRTVNRLRRADDLSDERAADILAAAGAVDDELVTITTTTTTTTTTLPPAPTTNPGRGPKGDDQGGHAGKGKGKG